MSTEETPLGDGDGCARDRFVDALLTHALSDTELDKERRVARVMRQVNARRMIDWRWWAVPVAALVTLSLLLMPNESSADSIVKSAIRAASAASERRYEVEFTPVSPPDRPAPTVSTATLDVRDGNHVRCEFHRPGGGVHIRGRSDDVAWEVHPNGDAVILDRAPHWPRWIETPDGSLLVDSMAGVLDGMRNGYSLSRPSATKADAQSTTHVRARRSGEGHPADPETIDLWVADGTNEIVRLEMRFAPPARMGEGPSHAAPRPRDEAAVRGTERRPPPKSIVFTRIPAEPFPAGWFDPPPGAQPAPALRE